MKIISKLSLAVLATSVIAATIASADDQQLQNRLAIQRAQSSSAVPQTTVAVYAGQRGNGPSADAIQEERSEARFELRTNAHGQTFGLWVKAK